MPTCLRPECDNDLKTGSSYCSTRCAALDRKRVRLERLSSESTGRLTPVVAMPLEVSSTIIKSLGENGNLVVGEVNTYLQENNITVIPFPTNGQTYGDWTLSFDGTKDFRPGSTLDFDTIEMMLRSGPVIFAMEMKRAQVYKVFSEGRFKVESPDKELAEVADAALRLVMPKMAQDFTYSAFAYGVSFQEELWETRSKYELGLSKSKGAQSSFVVPKVPNSVKPSTVSHIMRDSKGHFKGFAQNKPGTAALSGLDVIEVDETQSLVIPLNERFRNLWGESFLKALYPIWLWYEITLRTMARYMERMAMPVTVAKAPSRSSVMIEGQSKPVRAMDLALALAGNVAKSSAVAIPSDRDEQGNPLWELEYLTADEKGQAFIQVLEFLQQEMIRAGLSADRSLSQSSGGVGSYNIGELHAQASSLTSEMILQQFVYYLNQYFMPSFSLYNRGKNGPPIWLKTQAIDLQERALLMQLIGVAGNAPAGQEFFWSVNWETLADTSNIPRLDQAQIDERKKKIQDEQMDKMEQQQEIMAKNAAPVAKGGASAFPEKDAQKNKTSEKGNAKLEDYPYIVNSLLNAKQISWILGPEEVALLLEYRGFDEETIKLFNPFHSRADGKFTSGPGGSAGGTASGGQNAPSIPTGGGDIAAREVAMQKAKGGGIVKTTGKILGLGGLGLVGLAILGAGGGSEPQIAVNSEQNKEKTEKLRKEIEELTKNWPKYGSAEEAVSRISEVLRANGFDVNSELKVEVGSTADGIGGYYDANTNTLRISDQFAPGLTEGDPISAWVIAHEIAHSGQEFAGQDPNWGNSDEIVDGTNFGSFLEGQNDLTTGVIMSDMYGQEMSQEEAVEQGNRYRDLKSKLIQAETGVTFTGDTVQRLKSVGYSEESSTWAGLASAKAAQIGQSSQQYLAQAHAQGMSSNEHHQILVDLFPDEMSSGGYYDTSSGKPKRKYPTMSEVRRWMANHGYTDPDKAKQQMLKEAAK